MLIPKRKSHRSVYAGRDDQCGTVFRNKLSCPSDHHMSLFPEPLILKCMHSVRPCAVCCFSPRWSPCCYGKVERWLLRLGAGTIAHAGSCSRRRSLSQHRGSRLKAEHKSGRASWVERPEFPGAVERRISRAFTAARRSLVPAVMLQCLAAVPIMTDLERASVAVSSTWGRVCAVKHHS